LARLAGIPRRIGYGLSDVRPFLSDAIAYTPGLHEVEQNLRLVGSTHPSSTTGRGDVGKDRRLRFAITSADASWAAARLALPKSRVPNPLFIAIHPGAGAAVKLWTVDGWVSVANALAQHHGATIVLTGGASEAALVQSIASRVAASHIVLAGETNLGQLAAVFSCCRLALGPDSGPLHLAVAVGAPTVHLLGPADPALFGPWGDPAQHIVVQVRFFDQPCHKRPCNRLDYSIAELPLHPCMQTITVDDVLAAAECILAGQRQQAAHT
jgi:ADP-heptose:LPS heptosyltransferase